MFLNTGVAYCWHLQENVNTYCRPIMTLSKMSPVTFYIYASNSLIIHKENTKEINVQWAFGNQMKTCLLFNPQYLLLKTFCLRRNIKHFPVYNLTRSPWMIWPLRSTIWTPGTGYRWNWPRSSSKYSAEPASFFQPSSQCFIWWNTDLHNKKYNKWKFSQGFTFTHVQNFGDNDNRDKLRVINLSLEGTSL